MEGSESEAVFDSLNLNPQLFINEVLNSVDDLVDGAFDYFHRQAASLLKIERTDRSDDLDKGVAYIRNMIQSVLDKRLAMWENYCLKHCFAVPEGFSLPEAEPSRDHSVDLDTLGDPEVDAQLDSLRDKLALVGKDSTELNRLLRQLERQSVSSNHCSGSVNEAIQLYDQHSMHEMFQELTQMTSEFRTKMGRLKRKRVEETERIKSERTHIASGDLWSMNNGNGIFCTKLEDLQEFINNMQSV